MIDEQPTPPRFAQTLLAISVRRRDADAIAGDLLEEYRAVRQPRFGTLSADAWYIGQVLRMVWQLAWPFALALVVARSALAVFMSFPLSGRWNPSLVPAPNVSMLDALLFLAAGYYGARRTGRAAAGIVNAGVLGVIDFALFAGFVMLFFPDVLTSIREKPFILVIGGTFLAMAMGFALALGAIGATIGRLRTPRFVKNAG
jgi:hypothetical protein